MEALIEHLLSRAQQTSGQHNDRSSAVTSLDVLCGREVDELQKICTSINSRLDRIHSSQTDHFCSRMKSLNAPQNGGSVVSDDNFSLGSLDLDGKRVREVRCIAGA
jgi:hypothetical protein